MADEHPEIVEPIQPIVQGLETGEVRLGQVMGSQPVQPVRQLGEVARLDQDRGIALVNPVVEEERQGIGDTVDPIDALPFGQLVERRDRFPKLLEPAPHHLDLDRIIIPMAQREQRFVAVIHPGTDIVRRQVRRGAWSFLGHCRHAGSSPVLAVESMLLQREGHGVFTVSRRTC